VDNFSSLVIEETLIKKLPTLFGQDAVLGMSDTDISSLAAETDDTTTRRNQDEERLAVLQTGLQDLKSLFRYRSTAPDECTSWSEEDPKERELT
jgi:hypothetical protein